MLVPGPPYLTRDIQTNESLHSQDLKMTNEKSKPTNSGQSTPMNRQHKSMVLEKITVLNTSNSLLESVVEDQDN